MEKNPIGPEALKKMIPQLLISFSLFSLAVSYSSLFNSFTASSSSLLYPSSKFHHYFSATSSFRFLSKNCLFLICNGLLVFLSKTSGFIQPPSAHDLDDLLQLSPIADTAPPHRSEPFENSSRDGAGQISIFIAESEEERGEAGLDDSEKEEVESEGWWLFDGDAEQLYGEEDEEGEDGDEDEKSREELNQKFEEFIRKMKEEIIINEGFISLLLTVFQERISSICIPNHLSDDWLPCKFNSYYYQGQGKGESRLLAAADGSEGQCERVGKSPLLSLKALHDLHIFIFVHVLFSALTILFGTLQIRQWKHWEDAIQKKEAEAEATDPEQALSMMIA